MKKFVFVVAGIFAFALSADGQRYKIANIPTLGGAVSSVVAMNNLGQVVGNSDISPTVRHAFLWSKASGIQDLGTLGGLNSSAVAVNDNGQVVGSSDTAVQGEFHAFLWSAQTGMIDLGSPGQSCNPLAINASGMVVGVCFLSNRQSQGFLWTAANGMQYLFGNSSGADAVNDKGLVLGGNLAYDAFLWSPSRGIQSLDYPGAKQTQVFHLNDNNQVVGYYQDPFTFGDQTFVWTQVGGFQNLPTLGGRDVFASLINSSGQVAGFSTVGPASTSIHAFIWSSINGIKDISPLPLPYLSSVTALSNKGEVIGLVHQLGKNGFSFDWTPAGGSSIITGLVYGFALNDAGQIAGSVKSGSKSALFSPYIHVTLASSLNPSKLGQSVTLTATLTSAAGAPPNGELVKFMKGTKILATVPLVNGIATFTSSTLPIGTNLITADYAGDVNYDPTFSASFKQVVAP